MLRIACFALVTTAAAGVKVDWTLPREPEEITTSEAVELSWASGFHNVYQVYTKEALDACDTTNSRTDVIVPNGGEGSAMLPAPADGEMAYYLCEISNHCERGMKLTLVGVAGGGGDPGPGSIVDVAAGDPELSTLVAAVKAAGLVDALSGDAPFTAFLPTNAAFDALDEGTVETLLKPENKEDLKALLLHHVADGATLSTGLSDGMSIPVLNGDPLTVDLGPAGVFIDNAKVVEADIEASNGVIHKLDAVLGVPSSDQSTTVFDIIKDSPDHKEFEKLLEAHDYDERLADPFDARAPWTVFAPTDDAIDGINPLEAALLALDGNGIAKYHIVQDAKVMSAELSDGQEIVTWNGDTLEVKLSDGKVMLLDGVGNEATVTTANLTASNGVVHVIDTMLFPTADGGDESDAGFALGPALAAFAAALFAALN